jgi:hypothetical protein
MNQNLLYGLGAFAGSIPYLSIVVILVHYVIRRANWKRRSKRSMPGFCPSSAALGMVFLFTQVFYRPSIQHSVEARLVVDAEDDDQGDPEAPAKPLDRQLRRIRRGEPVEILVLRV